jgi:predicted nucleic-acid-binding protein
VIALDTNVLVRMVVNDDEQQVHRARAFLAAQNRVLISRTVLLELGWVLGGARYQLSRGTIASSIRTLLTISKFEIEDRDAVLRAVEWYERGMDFADAMHLASIYGETEFATFDVALRRTAQRLGIACVVAL